MSNPAPPMATPPNSGGGMPKWLIILLVILLIVVLGCCGAFAACRWACAKAGQAVSSGIQAATQKIDDERKRQGIEVDLSGKGLAVPAEFPADIPLYPGFKILSKAIPPGTRAGSIVLSGSASPSTLSSYYEKEMASKGWKQESATADQQSFAQSYSKDDRTTTISGDGAGSTSSLQIVFGAK